VLRQLDRLTDGSAELLEAGAEVLRQLAASGTATADTVRAAAELDEELVYAFDHNLSVVNPVTRDDYFVVLLIERMAAVGTA
jgi:transketolase C-terminal domain/subunit